MSTPVDIHALQCWGCLGNGLPVLQVRAFWQCGRQGARPASRARTRSAGRAGCCRSHRVACPALARASRAARLQCLTLGTALGVTCFSVAHPNASNGFKATFVLQCCIDSDALAPHCNALQRVHWCAMPDTRQRHRGTSSAALPRSRQAGLGSARGSAGLGWTRLGAGCQLWETPRA